MPRTSGCWFYDIDHNYNCVLLRNKGTPLKQNKARQIQGP